MDLRLQAPQLAVYEGTKVAPPAAAGRQARRTEPLPSGDVQNALGAVQSLLVLGGSSDIGAAIAERLVPDGCRSVVLAGRRPEAMEPVAARLRAAGAAAITTPWDAVDIGGHADAVKAAWEAAATDIDCVVLASGVLGDQPHLEDDPASAAELAVTNYAGPVSTLLHVARHLEEQGHGTIVVLSSVAAERARRSNFVYGSSKAGLDAFAQGLGDALVGSGGRVMVVRPGPVRTRMIAGMAEQPFTIDPGDVADVIADGLQRGAEIVYAPRILQVIFGIMRVLPRPLWRIVSAR